MTGSTFRLFVSSTFNDLKDERNALRERVFPRLVDLSMRHGCHFQAIDLRWGVSEEAAVNQQTIPICLQELKRCQDITPRPNFIILLGNRYGWRPLPVKIESTEFEAILQVLLSSDRVQLLEWYRRDDNAVPSEYYLLAREGKFRDGRIWDSKKRILRGLLLEGIKNFGWAVNDKRRIKYEASATHQEIIHGALNVPDAAEHVFCFFREINQLPQDNSAREYADFDSQGQADIEAQEQLLSLKNELRQRMPGNIHDFTADWRGDGLGADHLDTLCEKAYDCLARVIECEAVSRALSEPAAREVAAHEKFGAEHSRIFTGRSAILNDIRNYINGPADSPLILCGPPGCGKSAIMAKAAQLSAQSSDGFAQIIERYIGATPASTNIRSLLQGLCSDIRQCCKIDQNTVPPTYSQLAEEFLKLMLKASVGHPLAVFIDALDLLESTDSASNLGWLPAKLAPNIKLIVSVSSGPIDEDADIRDTLSPKKHTPDCLSLLSQRMPAATFIQVESMLLEEAEILLDQWLCEARRSLQSRQRQKVLSNFCDCPYPLYLKLAFEEARRWHSFDELECDRNNSPGLSHNIKGLLDDLFTRLEHSENHGKLLVSRTLGYLAASRNGLSEDELLDILSDDPEILADFQKRSPDSPVVQRLPVIIWSRLHADIEHYLMERQSGEAMVMAFYHQQVNLVILNRYLNGQDMLRAHRSLAAYFVKKAHSADSSGLAETNPRALLEMPYHQYHGRQFPALMTNFSSKNYIDIVCMTFGQEIMLELLELGLAAAREERSAQYAVMVLLTWGYVFTSAGANIGKQIKDDIDSGQISRAVRTISNRIAPEQAGIWFIREAHQALDRNDHATAAEFIHAFLSIQPPHSMATIKDQLRLIDRVAGQDMPETMKILIALKPEDTGIRILLFLTGVNNLSDRLIIELRRIIQQIDEPYWRGICQLSLCCRAMRHGLSQATHLVQDLRETIRDYSRIETRSELQLLCARSYRWLRQAGFSLHDLDHPGIGDMEDMPTQPAPAQSIDIGLAGEDSGTFDFLPDRKLEQNNCTSPDWISSIHRALGILTDSAPASTEGKNSSLCQPIQAIFDQVSADPENCPELSLFWYSLLPPEVRRNRQFPHQHDFDLASMDHDKRIQVLFSLHRLGELPVLVSLLWSWSNNIIDSSESIEFCRTLQELSPIPEVDLVLNEFGKGLGHQQDTLAPSVILALIAAFIQHGRLDEALFWTGRLRSMVAPSMEINWHQKLDEGTILSYALLNLYLPPIPNDVSVQNLKHAAENWADLLIKSNRLLGQLIAEEFGMTTPNAGFLADRILAFWGENMAWSATSENKNLDCLSGILKLGVVNDDRERLRSWFFWLLILSTKMNGAQMDRWRKGVRGAQAIHLRYEQAFFEMLRLERPKIFDTEENDRISQVNSPARKLDIFKSVASMLGLKLVKANNQIFGEWADAALRAFSQQTDQALAFVFLSEASARIDQPDLTEAYLATVQALDEDLIEFMRERIELARISRKGGIDHLGDWAHQRTFKEAFQMVQGTLQEKENREDLLRLIKYLPRVPDLWDSVLFALCATQLTGDEREAIATMFLRLVPGVKN